MSPNDQDRRRRTVLLTELLIIGTACGLTVLTSCDAPPDSDLRALSHAKAPVDGIEPADAALTAPFCNGTSMRGCNVDLNVDHVVFVHGYASDQVAFAEWHQWLAGQNKSAGFKTYKVSLGQEANRRIYEACTICDTRIELGLCTPKQYDSRCIGWCSASDSNGCTAYDRSKNGICGNNGQCVLGNSTDGARKHVSVWADDLANFFWNNHLVNLPDRSVVLVTHSTGAPAVAKFMVNGNAGSALSSVPSMKVKRVINIQAALGGACGVSGPYRDDAINDLNDLQDDRINYDFGMATYGGVVPWLHIQSKGETGLFGDECEGGGIGSLTNGDTCAGTSHDGVTNNWKDNTSVRHPNGAGDAAGSYPYSITVRTPEQKYCHSTGDDHPSYRTVQSRFRSVFARPGGAVPVEQVRNPRAVLFTPPWGSPYTNNLAVDAAFNPGCHGVWTLSFDYNFESGRDSGHFYRQDIGTTEVFTGVGSRTVALSGATHWAIFTDSSQTRPGFTNVVALCNR